jgi:hypothetical protein
VDPHAPDGPPDDAGSAPRPPESSAPTNPPPPLAPPRVSSSTHGGAIEDGATGVSWTPPDAGTTSGSSAGPGGVHVEVEDADGPPMPPPARRRRRRRRAVVGVAIVAVIGIPVGLAVGGLLPGDEAPSASGSDDAEVPRPEGDADAPRDGLDDADALQPPDVDALDGADAVYGRLLLDIDASERIMMNFQDEVATVFSVPAESPDALVEALSAAGAAGRDDLEEARDRFDDQLDEAGAEEIRERYLAHLDSWVEYMDAVSEDPGALSGEGAGAGYTVVINATADAFARALEEQLPADTDTSVSDYADEILDRGFRDAGDAQV